MDGGRANNILSHLLTISVIIKDSTWPFASANFF